MKFEFSRRFLLGSAVVGALTSCGALESPDNWAQKPMEGAAPSVASNPAPAPEVAASEPAEVTAPEAEEAAKPAKPSWWNQNKEVAPAPEPTVSNEAADAVVENVAPEPKAKSGWSGWWNQNKEEEKAPEVQQASAEVAESQPAAVEEPKKLSFWQRMTGSGNEASNEEQSVAETQAEEAPAAQVQEAAPAQQQKSDYPTATKVGAFNGYVYSPFNSRWINVKGVPSGSLVADPRFPLEEKKFFRVP